LRILKNTLQNQGCADDSGADSADKLPALVLVRLTSTARVGEREIFYSAQKTDTSAHSAVKLPAPSISMRMGAGRVEREEGRRSRKGCQVWGVGVVDGSSPPRVVAPKLSVASLLLCYCCCCYRSCVCPL
ncbi:hypothetical protein CLOM_g16559, partial [Closterium sp. NIES-68]